LAEVGAFALLGWSSDDPEGGVPERIVNVLARSLSAFGRVTFPCSTIFVSDAREWQMHGSEFVARYRIHSALGRIASQFSRRAPVDLTLLSTLAEREVRRLFNDPDYPWWNQGQFALISPPDVSPPELEKIAYDLTALFGLKWCEGLSSLGPVGVVAILRPGVDGDVAGLICASWEMRDRFEGILSRHAHASSVPIQYVSESELMKGLASSPPG
jgi:hypothetical protein